VALGTTLALLYLRGRRMWFVAIVHGVVGAAGLALLVLALRGPRHGDAMGAGSFGSIAAVLFGVALAFGLSVPLLRTRSPRIGGVVIATHASVAITGFVLLLAWISAD
jgi:hypothetical protein